MKNKGLFGLVFVLLGMSFLSFASADMSFSTVTYGIENGARLFIEGVRSFTAPFFEVIVGDYESSEFFWTKVLFGILLFTLVRFAVLRIPQFEGKGKGIPNVIAVTTSIISLRYLSQTELINDLFLPYTTMGIAILTIVPFVVFFFFLHFGGFGPAGRKLAWMLFGISFLVIWYNRSDELSAIANQIYGWSTAALVIVFMFDKQIHTYFGVIEDKNYRRDTIKQRIADIEARLNTYYSIQNPSRSVQDTIKKLESKRDALSRKL
jgi:hypothetical protein